ncbi:uncharacterized protein PAC_12697 [Phialocephala subalpina]|uniref:Uncharacterized protein n=1 Tax=Phialocephala subalpina TaxID=576137 RepID=A0A1L7XCM8_9HELO|nr:uncharacterized protein PAC_12697 [Phialocephala subalpina]
MATLKAARSSINEDGDKMSGRAATGNEKENGQIAHDKLAITSRENDATAAEIYSNKNWLEMLPDIRFDSTKSGSSNRELDTDASWFDKDKSATVSKFYANTVPSTDSIFPDSRGADFGKKSPESSEKPPTKEESGSFDAPAIRLKGSNTNLEGFGIVFKDLLDQNAKLVARIKEIMECQEQENILPSDQSDMTIEKLRIMKSKAEKESRSLKDLNKKLEKALQKTTKNLWEKDYDLRDSKTRAEKLYRELKNSVSIDPMAKFEVWDKTPLESIRDEELETLKGKNKFLEERVKTLQLEVQRLKGRALGAVEH